MKATVMEIKNPRNIRLHNLYMAEIRMVVNNCLRTRNKIRHGLDK
jgi:hypothetical protein